MRKTDVAPVIMLAVAFTLTAGLAVWAVAMLMSEGPF